MNPIVWDHLGRDHLSHCSLTLPVTKRPENTLKQIVPYSEETVYNGATSAKNSEASCYFFLEFVNACLVDSQLPECLHKTGLKNKNDKKHT